MFKTIVKSIYWVIFIPFSLIVLGLAYCEANKAYWDHRVKEMCEKDGGVTVFEHIELTLQEFKKLGGNQYGEISVSSKRLADDGSLYYIENMTIPIREGYLSVYKYEARVIRKDDQKLLALKIDYGRGGGDFPDGISHPSHFSCNNIEGFNSRLIKSTVHIKVE
jgi:hypothetical protein